MWMVFIMGGWLVFYECVEFLKLIEFIKFNFIMDYVVVILCGIYVGEVVLDLDYVEDLFVEIDVNFVMMGVGGLVEI